MPDNAHYDISNELRVETAGATIIIAPILEPESYVPHITDEELHYAGTLSNIKRKKEWMAWRSILHKELGTNITITYSPVGAPYIIDSDLSINVSHTNSHAAVIISRHKCAIDIEDPLRNFSAASSRFISAEERELKEKAGDNYAGLIWCAKETLYKFSGRRELDLISDIRISDMDISSGIINGGIRGINRNWDDHRLNILPTEDIICVWMADV